MKMEKDMNASCMRRVEPLSFSMGCLEGCEQNGDSSIKNSPLATNSLNRRKVKLRGDRDAARKSWGPSDKDEGNQEFWASIKEPYDFIMGTHLIPDSYEMRAKEELCPPSMDMELSWDPEDVSPAYVWSFSEFLDQYNELYEWLIHVQLKLYSHSNPPDKQSRMLQQEELRKRAFRRTLFAEQGERVALRYPCSEEEIRWRVNYLNNKWDQLQSTLTPVKGRLEEVEVDLDLVHEEDLLGNWLSTMEGQIQPITCRLPRGCSLHALQERYKDNQILLKDIEAHGPILKSVLRQYERLASTSDPPPPPPPPPPAPQNDHLPSAPHPPSSPSPPPPAPPKGKKGAKGVSKRAKSLEKRWYQIYLRSLEWHYYLEGIIANFKDQDVSCCSSDSEDEPVTKCRRLSASSFSSCASSSAALLSSRRKPRPQGWSEYDANSSEAGSYIEDDYVYVTNSDDKQERVKRSSLAAREKTNRALANDTSSNQGPMVGVEAVLSSPIPSTQMDQQENASVLNENEKNGNLASSKTATMKVVQNGTAIMDEDEKKATTHPVSTQTSGLRKVNVLSPNCGVFDYKHHDTDSDNNNGEFETVLTEQQIREEKTTVRVHRRYRVRSSTVRRRMDFSYDEEVDQEDLQQIIDSAILDQDWLNSNITTDSEDSLIEDEVPLVQQESMDTESEENSVSKEPGKELCNGSHPVTKTLPKPCNKESIHRLISDVEQLVREPLMKDHVDISPRTSLKPLPLGVPRDSKQRRIKQWLSSQSDEDRTAAIICSSSNMQDSCDASGELTTGESDIESDLSDNDLDISVATQKGSGDFLVSSENTPTIEGLPSLSSDHTDKVILRGKKRQQKEQRPWSVTEAHLMARISQNMSLINTTPDSSEELKKATGVRNVLSASESALNRILASSDETTRVSSIFYSDPMVSNPRRSANTSPSLPAPLENPSQSPTITSTSILNHTPTATSIQSASPSLINSGSMRRRRSKFRRRSNQFLGRRTDSGSDELNHCSAKSVRGKEGVGKSLPYSPYHPLTKSLSSESESVSGCPRVVKSSSFSGGCIIGQSGGMTSSTEKCLSDSSMMSGAAQVPTGTSAAAVPSSLAPVMPDCPEESGPSQCPSPRSVEGSQVLSPRKGGVLSDDQGASTHQEDVSSLSEQAWDPYQEFKYLSEPYSEDLDNDAARKLLDFGDDYRKYIDSDGSSFLGLPYRRRRSPHYRKGRPQPQPPYRNLDSDSELDDLHHVIEESKAQLSGMEAVLGKYSSQATLGLDFGDLLATANTNSKCLHDVLKHLQMEAPDLQTELNDVKSIVERWDALQKKAAERQRQSTQLRQLQRQVKALRLSMEGVVQRCGKYGHPHALDDPAQLGTKVDELKALLDENEGLRSDLSGLNVMVHRFSSEVGSSFTPLKDEMAELYRLWDETNRRVSGELSRMQSSEATWRLWEEQKTELSQALKQDSDTLKVIDAAIDNGRLTETVTASVHDVAKLLNERRKLPNGTKGKNQMNTVEIAMLNGKDAKTCLKMEDRLSDSGTSGYESCSSDDLSERERRLAYLRRLARDLEASLVPGSKAWNDISSTLAEAENELQGLQDQCRTLILRTAETLDPSSKQPSSRFSSNSKRRTWARDGKSFRSPRPERRNKSGGGGFRREWIWRVVRAALPFQAALLLLLCVACLLEPNCCDSVNTLNLSFTPQLRFVHGSPPV